MNSFKSAVLATLALSAVALPAFADVSGVNAARAAEIISQCGYTNVHDVAQVENGWRAAAKESGKDVIVILNNIGVRKELPRGQ